MKTYMKPAIAEVELFTQDAISLTIPKTVYKRNSASGTFKDENELVAYALQSGEALSGVAAAGVEF